MLEKSYGEILNRMKIASKKASREISEISLIAVSKRVEISRVKKLFELGHNIFGENYIKEGCDKYESFDSDNKPSFHLIGPLQSNKVKKAVGVFDLIHTIDRKKIVDEVAKVAEAKNIVQHCLVQVNVSGETSKSGVLISELSSLLAYALTKPSLSIDGLMCIGQNDATEEDRIFEFKKMNEIKINCEKEFDIKLPHLSMGMSADFELSLIHI